MAAVLLKFARPPAIAICGFLFLGCSACTNPFNTGAPIHDLAVRGSRPFPAPQNWSDVAWVPGGVFAIAQTDLRSKSRLVQLNLSTAAVVDVALTSPSECLANILHGIQPLGDGRILVNSSCPNGGARELDALDPTTGVSQLLVGGLDGAGKSGWGLKTGTGVTDINSSLCSSIEFLEAKQGRVVRSVPIGDGTRQWTLADMFNVTDREKAAVEDPHFDPMANLPNCESPEAGGLASNPALSPDHTAIAFFASTDALGKTGQARPNSDFELWFMGPKGENPGRYSPVSITPI